MQIRVQVQMLVVATVPTLAIVALPPCRVVRGDEPEEVPQMVPREVHDVASFPVYSLDASADGKQLAWCGFMAEFFDVVDTVSLMRVARCRFGGVIDLAFDPKGGRLALAGHDPLIWDFANGTIAYLEDVRAATGVYTLTAFTPDSSTVLAVKDLDWVVAWNAQSRRIRWQLTERSEVTSIDVSPDGELIALCCGSEGVVLRKVSSGDAVGDFAGPGSQIQTTGQAETRAQHDDDGIPIDLCFSPKENLCAVLVKNYDAAGRLQYGVELWRLNVHDGDLVAEQVGHQVSPFREKMNLDIAFSPDGRLIAVCGGYGKGLLLDVERLEFVATWQHPNVDPSVVSPDLHQTLCAEFCDGGAALATGHTDGSIVIWEVPDLRE